MIKKKKIGWPTNSVTDPTLTGKQVTTCSRKTEQREKKTVGMC